MDYTLCPSNFVIQPLHRCGHRQRHDTFLRFWKLKRSGTRLFGRYFEVFFADYTCDKQICVAKLQPLLIFACLISSTAHAIAPTRRPFGAGCVRASGSRALCACDPRGLYCVPNVFVLQPSQSCLPAPCAVASFCQNSAVSPGVLPILCANRICALALPFCVPELCAIQPLLLLLSVAVTEPLAGPAGRSLASLAALPRTVPSQ